VPTLREAGGLDVYVQCFAGSATVAALVDGLAEGDFGLGVADDAEAGLLPPAKARYETVPTPATTTHAPTMRDIKRNRFARSARRTCCRW
jgi:hypothetical protein